MEEEKLLSRENLERPINFRFPRGTSGHMLARQFNELAATTATENRSEVLRTAIEDAYSLRIAPGGILFEGLSEEEVALIEEVLSTIRRAKAAETDARALVVVCRTVRSLLEGRGVSKSAAKLLATP